MPVCHHCIDPPGATNPSKVLVLSHLLAETTLIMAVHPSGKPSQGILTWSSWSSQSIQGPIVWHLLAETSLVVQLPGKPFQEILTWIRCGNSWCIHTLIPMEIMTENPGPSPYPNAPTPLQPKLLSFLFSCQPFQNQKFSTSNWTLEIYHNAQEWRQWWNLQLFTLCIVPHVAHSIIL